MAGLRVESKCGRYKFLNWAGVDCLRIGYNRTVSDVSFSADEDTTIFGAKIIVYRVLLLNYKILFYCNLLIQFTFHINCLKITAYCLLLLQHVLFWMCHLKETAVVVDWISVYTALSSRNFSQRNKKISR